MIMLTRSSDMILNPSCYTGSSHAQSYRHMICDDANRRKMQSKLIPGELCYFSTHREIFSKSYYIVSDLGPIYLEHAPIDLEQQTDSIHLMLQINLKMVNTI